MEYNHTFPNSVSLHINYDPCRDHIQRVSQMQKNEFLIPNDGEEQWFMPGHCPQQFGVRV